MAKEAKDKNVKVKRPTAQKRDIQNEKRRLRNRAVRSNVRTAIREFEETLVKGDAKATKESLNNVYSIMDKSVKRGVFKQNKANRTKARLAARTLPAAAKA